MSFNRVLAELSLITLTLWLQSAGVAALIAWVRRAVKDEMHAMGAIRLAAFFVRLAVMVVALHGLEILLWAGFYRWRCLPSWYSAMYFSASSYSTLGCSDVSLPACWRTLAPLESVIGSLMCGLSVSLLFAIVTRLVNREERSAPKRQDPALLTVALLRGISHPENHTQATLVQEIDAESALAIHRATEDVNRVESKNSKPRKLRRIFRSKEQGRQC